MESLVERLRKRAEIRRTIRSEGDRIAELLEEAADKICALASETVYLRSELNDIKIETGFNGGMGN